MASVSDSFLTPYSPQSFHWRQAGRAKRWPLLNPVNLIPLWLLQLGTALSLFWLIDQLVKLAMAFTNDLLVKLPYLEPFQPFYSDPTPFVLLTLGIMLSLLPWLLDGLLRLLYGLQPLSITTLSTYSPEASRVLQRYCRQRRWSLPVLRILPTSAPVALTYGNLPRNARIVVSQGLLQQLADDEIATICASCLGHIAHWDFVVMSLFMLVTQLPYSIYRQLSDWGNWIEGKKQKYSQASLENQGKRYFYSCLFIFYFFPIGAIASFAYGVWCLLSGPALWLSQLRTYYSDRLSAELTGNPNGLTRALLKIAQGVTQDIQKQGHTSWLLESLATLTPVSYGQAITLGNLHSSTQVESILAWDCLNPYRYWLNINNTHPLMGDRLQRLSRIAAQWGLETELNLVEFSPIPMHPSLSQSFLLQAAPFLGIALGIALGVLSWLLGAIGILLGITQLAWMYGDWWLMKGFLPIGFSIGTIVRINSLFPDITSTTRTNTKALLPSLPHLLANSVALPILNQPGCIQGKLLGRQGISNWLGQDLLLHSSTGLIKLHYVSFLGPVGNLLPSQSTRPCDLVGKQIVATGWFRRGATPWMDIALLQTKFGKTSRSFHPVWSTLLAGAAALWGASLIIWGAD